MMERETKPASMSGHSENNKPVDLSKAQVADNAASAAKLAGVREQHWTEQRKTVESNHNHILPRGN
jgi:hypothetical protein